MTLNVLEVKLEVAVLCKDETKVYFRTSSTNSQKLVGSLTGLVLVCKMSNMSKKKQCKIPPSYKQDFGRVTARQSPRLLPDNPLLKSIAQEAAAIRETFIRAVSMMSRMILQYVTGKIHQHIRPRKIPLPLFPGQTFLLGSVAFFFLYYSEVIKTIGRKTGGLCEA